MYSLSHNKWNKYRITYTDAPYFIQILLLTNDRRDGRINTPQLFEGDDHEDLGVPIAGHKQLVYRVWNKDRFWWPIRQQSCRERPKGYAVTNQVCRVDCANGYGKKKIRSGCVRLSMDLHDKHFFFRNPSWTAIQRCRTKDFMCCRSSLYVVRYV